MDISHFEKLQEIHDYNISVKTRELFLNPCDANSQTDILLASNFIKNLRYLENIDSKQNITIHQYNAGGEWQAAFAIYDAILNAQCHVTIIGHGEVQSAGVLILQSADLRLIMPHCEIMCHEGTSGIHPDLSHKAAKSWAAVEREKEELLYDIYADKCMFGKFFTERNYKRNRVKAYLKTQMAKHEDWVINPMQAIEYGFIDDIIGSKKYPHISSIITL